MHLNKIDDPRDQLQKARRFELINFARAQNIKEIDPDMPAELMRQILRQKGLTRITIPPRPLGSTSFPRQESDVTPGQVNAIADLARQWEAQKQRNAGKPLVEMNARELRAECRHLDIKLGRTDTMDSMRQKIEAKRGENAA